MCVCVRFHETGIKNSSGQYRASPMNGRHPRYLLLIGQYLCMTRLSAVCLIVSHQFYSLILIDDELWKVGQAGMSVGNFYKREFVKRSLYTSYRSGFSSCPNVYTTVAYVGHLTRNCYHFFPVWPLRFLDLYLGRSGRRPLSFIWCVAAPAIPNKNSFVSGSALRAQTHHMLRQSKRCVKRRPVAVLSCFWRRR